MLSLHQFEKSFGSQVILKIEDLSFVQGIHWVKGKNGSGKSTLFNCLAGLSPFNGEISFNDLSLKKSAAQYKFKVNYSQSEPLFPAFLTGNEMINFFAKLKKAPSGQVELLTKQLSVKAYADQPCGTYSSGMTKKLSIVLAFLGQPELIILDEPLITLDTEAQKLVSEMIVDAHSKGVSFLFSTHQDFDNALIKASHSYIVANHSLEAEQ
ncbi:MAG: ABC-2 type transport system ATP-binding protein [Roseivirga sp.]|jgi:ABC-2 type transport system ATP-binding protein